MSSAGMGSILNQVRAGRRPPLDPRNRLIIPAIKIILELSPKWVFFENVVAMKNTIVESQDRNLVRIVDLIQNNLAPQYKGKPYVVEFADYGIPQRRERLITVYTKDPNGIKYFESGGDLIPAKSHSKEPSHSGLNPWITVIDSIGQFPHLDSIDSELNHDNAIPFHYVPLVDPVKYEWIRNTPVAETAFNNQCINDKCKYQFNPKHGSSKDKSGINRPNFDTLLYCVKCGSLLPRPYTLEENGEKRIMRGYTSAYKRMPPNLPAPTLSRNFSFPCSDQKIHPTQNRVLSLDEAMKIQTIDKYNYKWGPIKGDKGRSRSVATDSLIRMAIADLGESILKFLGAMVNRLSALLLDSICWQAIKKAELRSTLLPLQGIRLRLSLAMRSRWLEKQAD
jgi:DNA (cytosine-5)-methyltransferase 1